MMAVFHLLQSFGYYGFGTLVPLVLVAKGFPVVSSLRFVALTFLGYPVGSAAVAAADRAGGAQDPADRVRPADGGVRAAVRALRRARADRGLRLPLHRDQQRVLQHASTSTRPRSSRPACGRRRRAGPTPCRGCPARRCRSSCCRCSTRRPARAVRGRVRGDGAGGARRRVVRAAHDRAATSSRSTRGEADDRRERDTTAIDGAVPYRSRRSRDQRVPGGGRRGSRRPDRSRRARRGRRAPSRSGRRRRGTSGPPAGPRRCAAG